MRDERRNRHFGQARIQWILFIGCDGDEIFSLFAAANNAFALKYEKNQINLCKSNWEFHVQQTFSQRLIASTRKKIECLAETMAIIAWHFESVYVDRVKSYFHRFWFVIWLVSFHRINWYHLEIFVVYFHIYNEKYVFIWQYI